MLFQSSFEQTRPELAFRNKEQNKLETNSKIIDEQRERILKKEEEAKRLEKIEAELLRRLQQTQQKEHEVFSMLESAMVDSAKPRQERYKTKKPKSRLRK